MGHRIGGLRLAALAILAALAAFAGCGGGPTTSSPPAGKPTTTITVDGGSDLGVVDAAVLGDAYLWPLDGMGSFDAKTDAFYPSFLDQLRGVLEPGSLRYPGGVSAEVFHWERAIGPQSARLPNAYGPVSGESPSTVGPDEFGRLLDDTGAVGVITVNFGTGTAAEAGAFVAYMTGAPGSSKWADLRVRNGHRAPYDVPYWEVGNEEERDPYWRSGRPYSVGGPSSTCSSQWTCEYVYGGSTSFYPQRLVGYDDRRSSATYSTGLPDQVFYVEYPPVTPGTATVFVNGLPWHPVATLVGAGRGSQVYVLDPSSGKITFGDGVNGAIPPKGAIVTASYVSGPHDGFVQFYRAMKAANPHIHVCSSDWTISFMQTMGTRVPYDCIEYHPYVNTGLANDLPIGKYEKKLMVSPDEEATSVAGLQKISSFYAHRKVPVVLSEYGQATDSNPTDHPYFHDSLDEALLNASQLANWIRLGVPVADRQVLAGEAPPPAQCCRNVLVSAPEVTTAAIETAGPDPVVQPTGSVYHLFAPLAGGTVVAAETAGKDPALATVRRKAVLTLSVLAVRAGQVVYVLVINRSPTGELIARVSVHGASGSGKVPFAELDGPSALSYNTPGAPNTVRLSGGSLSEAGGAVAVALPAHSVMRIAVPLGH